MRSTFSKRESTFDTGFNVSISFSVEHAVESLVMDVVIDSVSEGVTEGSNLLLEDVNDPFKIGEFTVSSVGLLVVESFLGGKGVLGIDNILVRLSGELPSISLSDEGNLKVDGELLEVSLSLDDISFESGNLSLGLDLILGGVE